MMTEKFLIQGFVGLLISGAFASFLAINPTPAQIQVSQQNTSPNTPPKLEGSEQTLYYPKGSPTATRSGTSLMFQQRADRHFIQMMIPHHQGAVDMANLALSQAKHPEIKKLAEGIKTDQNQEIQQMKAWYRQWYGTEVPTSSGMGMMSMRSSTSLNQEEQQGMSMNGCMKMMGMNMMGADLAALKNTPDFDKAFIEQMIPHHKMAVMMAGMVLDSEHPEIRNLAKSIIQTQSAEIEQMQQWNQTWFR